MAKVDGSISSLIQGVSQQPARERLPGQCELQENYTSDPVNGLTRRGPTEHVGQLINSPDLYNFTDYDAGSLGHFEIAHKANEIKVFNLDGTENTVTVDGTADTYIPEGDLRFIGIDEDIYILDPAKVTAMLPDTRDYIDNAGLVFMLGGQYGRTYKIIIDWNLEGVPFNVEVEHTTPDGSSASHIEDIATDVIIQALYDELTLLGNTGFQASLDNFDNAIDRTQQYHEFKDCNSNTGNTAVDAACSANKSQYNSAKADTATYGAEIIAQLDIIDNTELRTIVTTIMNDSVNDVLITDTAQVQFSADKVTYNSFIDSQAFANVFNLEIKDDVMYFRWQDETNTDNFTISIEDGDGGTNMFAVNNVVKDVGELPRFAPQGYVVRVSESASATVDDWYLEFIVESEDSVVLGDGFGTEGTWVETVAPDVEYLFDTSTMPHLLRKTGDTTFTLQEGEWEERRVGDDETNPLPSFIGHGINDINAFQGRLTLVSDVNLILSRTNRHTDFFNTSATAAVDDDPIDISSSLGTYILRSIVPHNRDLVVFSDNAQFILFGRNALTFENSSLVLTTEFESDLTAQPVGAGRNVFFSFKYGNFSGIQEFYTDGTQDANDSRPVTQHVLQYVKGTVLEMPSTTNFKKLIVRTNDDLRTVYVYEYIWNNNEKVQNAWSLWKFSDDIRHMFFVDNLLYIVMHKGDSYEFYTLDLDNTPDDGVDYRVELDRKVVLDNVNTTATIPYMLDDIDNYLAVQGEGCPHPGMRVAIDSITNSVVTFKGDMGGGTVLFGRKYTSRYVPTAPFVRDQTGVKIGSGKLTIKQYIVHFDDTGYFKAIIKDRYGYESEVIYNGRRLGDPINRIGKAPVGDGSFLIPYKKNVDSSSLEITSDSHLPLSLIELEWIGQWRKKGRRITGG